MCSRGKRLVQLALESVNSTNVSSDFVDVDRVCNVLTPNFDNNAENKRNSPVFNLDEEIIKSINVLNETDGSWMEHASSEENVLIPVLLNSNSDNTYDTPEDNGDFVNTQSSSQNIQNYVCKGDQIDSVSLESSEDPAYIPDSENEDTVGDEESDNELLDFQNKSDKDKFNNPRSVDMNIVDSDEESENAPPNDQSNERKCRPAKGRKRKYKDQTQKTVKQKVNSNASYFNYKGIFKQPKRFIDFKCTCLKQCHKSISSDMRVIEFNKFWELGDYNAQNMFIAASVKEIPKVRRYTNHQSKRSFSRTYSLKSVLVCRDMFVNTLRISTKRINTALCKLRSKSSLIDLRGKAQAGKNKLSDDTIENIKQHINKLPRYKSHYRRSETESLFLPPEMTLQKMYSLYVSDCADKTEKPASFSSYRRVFFGNFNLKFKSLKKDTCNVCDTYAAKMLSANADEKVAIESDHKVHNDLWIEAREKMKTDMEMATHTIDIECCTFDLEKTLPLPRIPTNIIFYKRQVWLYNAGVHSAKQKQGFCYIWTEGEAGRGAQEIGSCLYSHVHNEVGSDITTLILWSDSCGGQNRNIKIVLILKAILERHPSLQTIHLRFLVSGHSFLPNDTDFSDIESSIKHVQRLYLPEEYICIMKNCRKKKPLKVKKMQPTEFIGTENLEKMITNRKVDQFNNKINWLKIREIKISKKDPWKIYTRQNFTDPFAEVNIEKKPSRGRPRETISFNNSLKLLWPDGKVIAAPKLKDIKSIMHLISADAKPFYMNLKGSRDVEDDIDGFSGELDFVPDVLLEES